MYAYHHTITVLMGSSHDVPTRYFLSKADTAKSPTDLNKVKDQLVLNIAKYIKCVSWRLSFLPHVRIAGGAACRVITPAQNSVVLCLLYSVGLCWTLLDSVGLCWTLLGSVGLCWTLLDSIVLTCAFLFIVAQAQRSRVQRAHHLYPLRGRRGEQWKPPVVLSGL